MSKIIESYTIKQNFTFSHDDISKINLEDLLKNHPNDFIINYKETPKFPNGAEVFAPEEGTRYFYSYCDDDGVPQTTWNGKSDDFFFLKSQMVFLGKDKCHSSTVLKDRHLEIVQKVYEINAENNWVVDWNNKNQNKYYCYWLHTENKINFACSGATQRGVEVYYGGKAEDYIKTLSEKDIKAFLLIYT